MSQNFLSNRREMLENAVYQQLFVGNKRIQGKNPEHEMQLTGIEKLLEKFISDLDENLDLIIKLKIEKYIQYFEKLFEFDLSATYKRIMTNFDNMGGLDQLVGQEKMVIYLVLTKLVEALREQSYKQWGFQKIKKLYEEKYKQKLNNKQKKQLQNLAATNNPNISLLYNLSFIMKLANIYGSNQFQITLKRLTTLRVNRIIQKLSY